MLQHCPLSMPPKSKFQNPYRSHAPLSPRSTAPCPIQLNLCRSRPGMDPSSRLMPVLNPPCRIHAHATSAHIHAMPPLPIITGSIPPSKSPHKQPPPKFPMPLKQPSCPHQFHAAIAHHSPSQDPCRRHLVDWRNSIMLRRG